MPICEAKKGDTAGQQDKVQGFGVDSGRGTAGREVQQHATAADQQLEGACEHDAHWQERLTFLRQADTGTGAVHDRPKGARPALRHGD